MQEHKIKIIISGGGSGGHVFPAIAIGKALQKRVKDIKILFVGAKGKIEMEKVPEACFQIIGLPISGIHRRSIIKNLKFPFKLLYCLLKAARIIKKFKPNVVVGVGGFASGPVLYMAARKKIPTLIQEQNSFPGITNRIMSKKVTKICSAYEGLEKFFDEEKIVITGNPIREIFLKNDENKKEKAREIFALEADRKTLLVVGGSQGARSINRALINNLVELQDSPWQVIWQTGEGFFERAKDAVSFIKQANIKVLDFIKEMDLAYAAADIVISRAGAIAISELCVLAKPTILVPLSTAAADHQTKNAKALEDKQAAILLSDEEISEKLMIVLSELNKNENKIKMLSDNIKTLAKPQAVDKIVDEILDLTEYKDKY